MRRYEKDARAFLAFLTSQGMATQADAITREHLEHFFADEQSRPRRRARGNAATIAPATVAGTYRSLQQLWRWLVDEGEATTNPFDRMRPPHVPEQPVPVLTEDQLKALLATCKGSAPASSSPWLAYHDLLGTYPDIATVLDWRPFWEPDARGLRLLGEAGGKFIYTPMSREKHRYILQDVRRLAAQRTLEITWPVDRDPCWEVPHLAYLAVRSRGFGAEFIDLAYQARWQQGRDICNRKVVGELAERLGLDPGEAMGAADDPEIRRQGTLALLDVHSDDVFGVPFFVHHRDKYWGIDRLPPFIEAVRRATPSQPVMAPEVTTSVKSSDAGHAGGCG